MLLSFIVIVHHRGHRERKETLVLTDVSKKAMNQVVAVVSDLLEKRMPREKTEAVASLMATGQFTHDFPKTVSLVIAIGLPIRIDMPDTVYYLMDYIPRRVPVDRRTIISRFQIRSRI